MRIYYIFNIKPNIRHLYDEKEESLYYILKKIKKINKSNVRYGVFIYNQICQTFEFESLQNYFSMRYEASPCFRYKILDRKNKELSYLELSYSCLFLKTNSILPNVFDILYLYNSNLFICDFINDDYFWLEKLHNYKKRMCVACK